MYRALDAEAIVATCETLRKRIAERFPGSGLSRVSVELLAVARNQRRVSIGCAVPIGPFASRSISAWRSSWEQPQA